MRVHDSQAYRKMDAAREHIRHILELREILSSVQTGFKSFTGLTETSERLDHCETGESDYCPRSFRKMPHRRATDTEPMDRILL